MWHLFLQMLVLKISNFILVLNVGCDKRDDVIY